MLLFLASPVFCLFQFHADLHVVREGYECTVDRLLEVTAGKVDKNVTSEAGIAAVMAQRACISLKIRDSISYVNVFYGSLSFLTCT